MKRINQLFLKFNSYYGLIWRKQLGQEEEFLLFMKKEWQQALAHIDDRVFHLAVDSCRDSRVLPPTLPQFIDMCKDIRKRDAFIRALPVKNSKTSEVAIKNLQEMKQMLSGKSNPA